MPQLNMFEPLEEQIKPASGNHKLVDYGAQNETSDYRIHVAYNAMRVYVFPTESARSIISRNRQSGIEPKQVYTDQIITASGYTVAISHIAGLQEVIIPPDIWHKHPIRKNMLTTTKGLLATEIVVDLLKRNMIPLPVKIDMADDKSIQISGTDILINSSLRLQVKCDLPGGDKRYGGTGNLFIQIAECNPYQRH